MLGECIAAVTVALHSASLSHGISAGLVAVVAGAVLLVFAIWWWYFENPAEEGLRLSRQLAFIWGYGHYFVLGSLGALGAGLQLAAAGSHGTPSSTDGHHGGAGGGGAGRCVSRRDRGAAGPPRTALGRPPARWSAAPASSCWCSAAWPASSGVGVATLLIGLVVAALVASDEIRRDDARREPAATAP